MGTPPSKSEKTLTGLLKPPIDEDAGSFVSGGPHGPKEGGNSLILDFYCQHLRRVLFVFASGGPYGPKRGGNIFNTGPLMPKFEEGTVSFMSWGPYGPRGGPPLVFIMVFIMVFICQHFGRVLIL